MLVGVVDVAEERGAEDAEREEEAEGEAEEDGGEDGVGDDHRVHVPAAALLLELPTIWGIVLQPTVINSPVIDSYVKSIIDTIDTVDIIDIMITRMRCQCTWNTPACTVAGMASTREAITMPMLRPM